MPEVDQDGAAPPRPRVVLLGASNLTLGVSTITQLARAQVGGPCDMYIALGHGRSYGQWSNILGRKLPGILQSELWEALAKAEPGPTYALVTDVGNDIAYCVEPEVIARWLAEAVAHLRAHDAKVVMTALPLQSIERLGPKRFQLFRRLYFPHKPLTYDMMRDAVQVLNEKMRAMAHCSGVRIAEQSGAWYGFDPIHLRVQHWNAAWGGVLAHWTERAGSTCRATTQVGRWLSLCTATPTERILWGIEQAGVQPARTLTDGTRISVF
ncbi:MAG: hypothetical protein IT430_10720 [Phycisphaerales bacterium]|nr:hypothetical protein [Phycisphaerales bacterium]